MKRLVGLAAAVQCILSMFSVQYVHDLAAVLLLVGLSGLSFFTYWRLLR